MQTNSEILAAKVRRTCKFRVWLEDAGILNPVYTWGNNHLKSHIFVGHIVKIDIKYHLIISQINAITYGGIKKSISYVQTTAIAHSGKTSFRQMAYINKFILKPEDICCVFKEEESSQT